ncbi:diguanylate cyclase domain-containing protein [Azohydromonas australica]|uniref:diguanylate cyclase domain-containing protein n=1 Tax=Azohydromonas australica TaxID=364039 RepID=UPI0009FF4418
MQFGLAAFLIAEYTRVWDFVYRWGGEEFCVLLRGCRLAQAAENHNSCIAEENGLNQK